MGAAAVLKLTDVARMLRLLNGVHDARDGTTTRWRQLLGGLCELTASRVALMSLSEADRPNGQPDTHLFGIGGPSGDLLLAAMQDGQAADPALRKLTRRAGPRPAGSTLTLTRAQLLDDDHWYASDHVRDVRRPLGLDDAVYSVHVLAPGRVARLCVARGWGERRPFGPRERLLVHLMHHHCAWLHRQGTPPADVAALALSPREKQTLWKLLAGRGEKQIATEMHLSINTVHHYVKALYKQFGVSSRAELLAKWMDREG